MSQITIIVLVMVLTFSYAIINGILSKITNAVGNIYVGKYSIYIWGVFALAAAFLVQDNFVYKLPLMDRRVIFVCFAILLFNIFIAKYSGYKPIGRYNLINFVIFFPLFEEIIFRGLVLPILNNSFQHVVIEIAYLPVTIAVIISAFLFSIAHLQYYELDKLSVRYMCFAFVGGILFGAIADYTQSIVIPVLLHIGFNLLSACYSIRQQKV
ncbi:CPBP family intramembrane glutamic endopeptidase [Bacillus niameyensis]|uniref:CPBP family intramembrane glutamic endopeptidase n=1 Tax=Bacillus niameyensis TaxID=1522308 RepID=UPI0008411CE2|nr:CPBP family intramembrane glutamic endopeptidase [Bacillus niameyensis]